MDTEQGTRTRDTCRYCREWINFICLSSGDWDWCAHLGLSHCAASEGGRHYPVNPVEGIDY